MLLKNTCVFLINSITKHTFKTVDHTHTNQLKHRKTPLTTQLNQYHNDEIHITIDNTSRDFILLFLEVSLIACIQIQIQVGQVVLS